MMISRFVKVSVRFHDITRKTLLYTTSSRLSSYLIPVRSFSSQIQDKSSDIHISHDEIDLNETKKQSPINKLHQHQEPSAIVKALTNHIVGQDNAKRAVAIAM